MTVATELEQVAAALEARNEEIIDAGVAEIRARIAVYGAMDVAGVRDVRAHVQRHQAGIVAALRGAAATSRSSPRTRRGGRAPASRCPSSCRPSAPTTRSCGGLMEIVEEYALSGRATLEAARPVMDYIDLAATTAGEAYVEAQQLLLAEGDRVRRDLLDDLLGRAAAGQRGAACGGACRRALPSAA